MSSINVFWTDNPKLLLSKDIIPNEKMTYIEKLNCVSRIIILVTILSFFYSNNYRLIVIGALTLFAIYLYYRTLEKETFQDIENFPNSTLTNFNANLYKNPANEIAQNNELFDIPTSSNPFSNVLVTDYDQPNRKPAPPSFNENIGSNILEQAKQFVVEANPDQPDIANKLFKNLGDQYEFEQSLQPFYSNASTTIPNDQTAFSEFCYGSMVSCKEGNLFACARNLSNYKV